MPRIDAVASEYQDRVTFVAVAGRSTLEQSALKVGDWFSPERVLWGYDDMVWDLYGVVGQPVGFLISGDGRIVSNWFGERSEQELGELLDSLLAAEG